MMTRAARGPGKYDGAGTGARNNEAADRSPCPVDLQRRQVRRGFSSARHCRPQGPVQARLKGSIGRRDGRAYRCTPGPGTQGSQACPPPRRAALQYSFFRATSWRLTEAPTGGLLPKGQLLRVFLDVSEDSSSRYRGKSSGTQNGGGHWVVRQDSLMCAGVTSRAHPLQAPTRPPLRSHVLGIVGGRAGLRRGSLSSAGSLKPCKVKVSTQSSTWCARGPRARGLRCSGASRMMTGSTCCTSSAMASRESYSSSTTKASPTGWMPVSWPTCCEKGSQAHSSRGAQRVPIWPRRFSVSPSR